MDAETLRAAQGPLKERYRAAPDAAVITLHAEGSLGEGITCSVETGREPTLAGLHQATGGSGLHAFSADMLLQALVASAGVTLAAVAAGRGVEVTGSVHADGDLDFRGTLGVDPAAAVGFRAIRLTFDLRSDATEYELAGLISTAERFCIVLQTLLRTPQIEVDLTHGP